MGIIKKLRFDEDVLRILRGLKWSENGISAQIEEQLPRTLYEQVNKALVLMGGKWNRSAKAHVFESDPRSQVEGFLETGTLAIEKDGFFETPSEVFAMMLDEIPIDPNITDRTYLEPSAGMGAILRALILCGVSPEYIMAVEKNPIRAKAIERFGTWVKCIDFMELPPITLYDRVYMNPPFEMGQDTEHVQKAYSLLKPGGKLVSVMSASVTYNTQKKFVEFRHWLDTLRSYIVELPAKSFHISGTDVNTVLVVIEKE